MQDFGEAVLDVVVAMAATSFCFMGVALKSDTQAQVHAKPAKAQQAVVRRVPAPQPPARVVTLRNAEDCPETQRV